MKYQNRSFLCELFYDGFVNFEHFAFFKHKYYDKEQ